MIIPLTHEDMQARRWPIVTTILVVLNVLVFLYTSVLRNQHEKEVAGAERDLLAYWEAHPDLDTPKSLEQLGLHKPRSVEAKKVDPTDFDAMKRKKGEDPGDQAELDRRADAMIALAKASPAANLGYVPKENNLVGLLTYQFVHGGIFHLGFNMWFMWLCACNLEDRWGRLIFLPVYLAAGVVAAIVHKLAMPESEIPLIGASGAVAGAMGAFLATFAKTRIRFFHWIFLRPGTFHAPAWVMLPLWVGGEIFWAVVLPSNADGTAHFAHIGGFVFGLAVAGVMVVTGIDRRLNASQEKLVTTEQDPRIVEASALIDAGQLPQALTALEAFLARDPGSMDGYLEYLRAATAANDPRRMAVAYGRLIDLHMRAQSLTAAADFFIEAGTHELTASIPLRTRSELASRLAAANMPDDALRAYASIFEGGVTDVPSARAAMAYARLLLATNRSADAVLAAVEASAVPELRTEAATLRSQSRML